MVVTENRAGGDKRSDHLSQECLRWVGVEPVADWTPRGLHAVTWSSKPCVVRVDLALPEHRLASTFAHHSCQRLIDELRGQCRMRGR